MDRVAFTPSADTESAFAILGDEDIRGQVAVSIAQADAPEIGISPPVLSETIEGYARLLDGAAEMRIFTANAHARLIGDRDEPVEILASEQVQIVRTERVALLPPITLPVQEVGAMSIIANITQWTWLVTFGLAAFTLLVGLILRPDGGEFSFALAAGLAGTGVALVLFGYLVPAFVFPSISSDTWMGVFSRLANHRRSATLIAGGIFAALGAATFLGTGNARSRRQRSTPLSVGRYRDQQRWSN